MNRLLIAGALAVVAQIALATSDAPKNENTNPPPAPTAPSSSETPTASPATETKLIKTNQTAIRTIKVYPSF